jgi:hypothetical protein
VKRQEEKEREEGTRRKENRGEGKRREEKEREERKREEKRREEKRSEGKRRDEKTRSQLVTPLARHRTSQPRTTVRIYIERAFFIVNMDSYNAAISVQLYIDAILRPRVVFRISVHTDRTDRTDRSHFLPPHSQSRNSSYFVKHQSKFLVSTNPSLGIKWRR